MNYNELSNKAHSNSAKHGFWGEKWSNEHCLMLVITEIGELVDADRKDCHADRYEYMRCSKTAWASESTDRI